jgi:thiamine-phosphate pyrophosphorylase
MPNRRPAEPNRPPARLYLVTREIEDAAAFTRVLEAAVAAVDLAAVLLRLCDADERTLINRTKMLLGPVQRAGAAAVIYGRAGIVARAGADGAHLTGIAAFSADVGSLKPARIAGCGGLNTRHDAMLAAERGADYVMFGEPEAGRRPSFAAIIERVSWWAEVFEVPCAGYAMSFEEAASLAAAGADFVAVGDAMIWDDPRGVAAAVADVALRVAAREAVA